MILNNELEVLTHRLHDFILQYNLDLDDELETLLVWINPNDELNNHQLNIPSLRVKNCIKLLINEEKGHDILIQLLRQYVLLQMRLHFFTRWEKLITFKDVIDLEKYYRFPMKYVYIFTVEELEGELNGFNKYLLNRNETLKKNLYRNINNLIQHEENFELGWKIYYWMVKGTGIPLTNFILDLLLNKIHQFSEIQMKKNFDQRFLIMKTYNDFILRYWPEFAYAMKISESYHEITTLVYKSFEKDFIQIKIKEFPTSLLNQFPNSEPALLEMKNVLLQMPDEYQNLLKEILKSLRTKYMMPSVTTPKLLLYYIRLSKCLFIIDPTGTSVKFIIKKTKDYIKKRSDLVLISLSAILQLNRCEIKNFGMLSHLDELNNLSKELRVNNNFQFEFKFGQVKLKKPVSSDYCIPSQVDDELLKKFLSWSPDPVPLNPWEDDAQYDDKDENGKKNNIMDPFPKDILDILLHLFDSNEILIDGFVSLLTKQMLNMVNYTLDKKWTNILHVLLQKFSKNSNRIIGQESNINHVHIMLRDIEQSEAFTNHCHNQHLFSSKLFPKIISYQYWSSMTEKSKKDYILPQKLQLQFLTIAQAYKLKYPGRKLNFYKNQGIVNLSIEFNDKTSKEFQVSIIKYLVIQCFDENTYGLTLQQLFKLTNLDKNSLQEALEFWCEEKVLYFNKNMYVSVENHYIQA